MNHNDKVDQILQHYGVIGQKWGVRRYQPYPKGSKTPRKASTRNKKQEDPKTDGRPNRPNVKELSDQELREIINRADLEKRYAALNKSEKSQGRKIVEKLLINPGLDALAEYNKKYMVKQIEQFMNSNASTKTAKKK